MATNAFKIVNLGIPGLATVTARLYDPDGSANGAAVAGVERGTLTGIYGATISVPDDFSGEVRWDSGSGSYASEDLNALDVPTVADIQAGLATAAAVQALQDSVDALSTTTFPAGAIEFTYTVTSSVSSLPIEGVEVWFATDAGGSNIVWKGDTNAFGVAQDVNGNLPRLDAGTYYVFRQKAGYVFVDPDIEVVS